MANLTQKLLGSLSPGLRRGLLAVLAEARRRSVPVYLVGGSVRDLLLGKTTIDVDLAVEGDAIALAQAVAPSLGAEIVVHPNFGTATLKAKDFTVDLATTRKEIYLRPGALPQVQPAPLQADLARRDFTINAMALGLVGPHWGQIIDPFGGIEDLSRKALRVLHEASFQDDATRILRAARYAARFSFQLDPVTKSWLQRDAGYLAYISGARLRHEFIRIFQEEEPEEAIFLLSEWGALHNIHPSLHVSPGTRQAWPFLQRHAPASALPLSYWCLLAPTITPDEVPSLGQRLSLNRRERETLSSFAHIRDLTSFLAMKRVMPSKVAEALDSQPEAAVWAMAALSPPLVRRRLVRYLREWRWVRPSLRPSDMLALGIPRGPGMREVMALLRAARLDGRVHNLEGEKDLLRRWLSRVTRHEQ